MSDSLSHSWEWQGAHSPYIVGLLTLCISIPLRQVKQEVTFVSKCWCRVRVFAHFLNVPKFYFSEEHADFLVVSSTRQLSFYSFGQKKQIWFSARQTLLKTYILNFCRVFQRIGCCHPYRRQSILFIFRGVISPILVYYIIFSISFYLWVAFSYYCFIKSFPLDGPIVLLCLENMVNLLPSWLLHLKWFIKVVFVPVKVNDFRPFSFL